MYVDICVLMMQNHMLERNLTSDVCYYCLFLLNHTYKALLINSPLAGLAIHCPPWWLHETEAV